MATCCYSVLVDGGPCGPSKYNPSITKCLLLEQMQ